MVTWQALGSLITILLGIGVIAFGLLEWFAAGMATVPKERLARSGCFTVIIGTGMILAATGVWKLW